MTIIEAIKKALKEQGVSESYAERVQKAFGVNAVDGVAAAVKTFKEYMLPAIEEAGKSAAEKASSEASKTAIANYEKTHGLKDGKPIAPDPTQPLPQKPIADTAPAGLDPAMREWFENQNKTLQELRAELERSKAEKAKTERLTEVKAAVQKAGLPETWVERFNAEAPIEEQVKPLLDEYTGICQKAINDSLAGRNPFIPHTEESTRTAAEWTALMNADGAAGADTRTIPLFE